MNLKSISSKSFKNISLKQSYKRSLFFIWPFFIGPFVLIFISFDIISEKIYLASSIFVGLVITLSGIIGPLAMLWSKQKQGLHDQWSNTYVVEK
jgi:hypothetical protein